MAQLHIEIDNPVNGYAQYRVIEPSGKVLFKSSGPAWLARELASTKLKQIEREGKHNGQN